MSADSSSNLPDNILRVRSNASWAGAAPRLSILAPTYRDDPAQLIARLSDCARASQSDIAFEFIILDDGSGDSDLTANIAALVEDAPFPAAFFAHKANSGRAETRNDLVVLARADSLLFLDADMAPDSDSFLDLYAPHVVNKAPIVFGGFSVDQIEPTKKTALHYAVTRQSDCISAEERAKDPAGRVCTSNLLVRREVLDAEPFDAGFTGWGWEDVEWALRASQRWPIIHIDNTATHLGLDDSATLIRKYGGSGANYAATVALHPERTRDFRLLRLIRRLQSIPCLTLLSPLLAMIARMETGAPMKARGLALKLHRALEYSRHLPKSNTQNLADAALKELPGAS